MQEYPTQEKVLLKKIQRNLMETIDDAALLGKVWLQNKHLCLNCLYWDLSDIILTTAFWCAATCTLVWVGKQVSIAAFLFNMTGIPIDPNNHWTPLWTNPKGFYFLWWELRTLWKQQGTLLTSSMNYLHSLLGRIEKSCLIFSQNLQLNWMLALDKTEDWGPKRYILYLENKSYYPILIFRMMGQ